MSDEQEKALIHNLHGLPLLASFKAGYNCGIYQSGTGDAGASAAFGFADANIACSALDAVVLIMLVLLHRPANTVRLFLQLIRLETFSDRL